jgi:hypothetical protein
LEMLSKSLFLKHVCSEPGRPNDPPEERG